jgi:hypothetical protein
MRLSVVVTIVDGNHALDRCLSALAEQQDPPDLEVIVPWDGSVPGIAAYAGRYPSFRFLALGTLTTGRPVDQPAGQHELFDRRRSAGLAAATGDVVAILEDRGVPRPDWARQVVTAHARLPHAAIGGAIENGGEDVLAWAVFFCDFSRYQMPFADGPREWVSDVNVSYKRRPLEAVADVWRDRYHEPAVHWALQRAGETLYLTSAFAVVQMRTGLRLVPLLQERFEWGRLFGHIRVREAARPRRMLLAFTAPLLPLVLFARQAGLQVSKRASLPRFLAACPATLLLLTVWSLGEAVAYLTDGA